MKRILSLLIAMVMTLGCVGITAMAEEAATGVAKIGDTPYATLADAAVAAKAGDTIALIADATIAENTDVTIPDGVTLSGNGYSISASGADHDTDTPYGYVVAGGNLTIKEITKIEKFSASYYDHVITIGEGASLEVFGKNRVSVGYGSSFYVTGTISNAKTANKSEIQPSLNISAGISIVGGNDTVFEVKNAYVILGDISSKNSNANAVFDITFENSIVDFTKQFAFAAPKCDTLNPTFNVNVKNSVLTTGTKLFAAAPGTVITVDNSTVTLGSYLRNSGELTLKNGSVLTGDMIQFGDNGGNDGTIVVDDSTLTINNNNTAYAMDGKSTGRLILKNGSVATIDYIKDSFYSIDDTSRLNVKGTENFEKISVAKIGTTEYTDFAAAMTDANAMAGDVTVEIYDKVTLNTSLAGNYDSIKFVGVTDNAEIYMEIDGYIEASSKNVSFADLKLSKSEGGYITNAGFMNLAFGVYGAANVSYTNCTFANGAYASKGKNTFTGCTFYRSYDRYGLWAYGSDDIVVDGCTFADIRGIKMYDENKGANNTTVLTVKNTDFSAVTDKPAIVLTYGESVTLEKNTYSSTGVFELDLDGAPNGTPVTSDVAPTCKNDNGACGVLVDGKIYTTVAQAAEVATADSTVTLLHNSTETVEFAEGVILDKNGFAADGVTVKKSVVALVTDSEGVVTPYSTLAEAATAAKAGDTITMLADSTVTEDITLPAGITFNGNGFTVSGGIIADGNITFAGITKAKDFDVNYTGTTITIGEGACLELTGTDRMVIGHNCTFNITGTITDAKTANVADLAPSLIVAAGASFTGTNLTFNVKNAYIKFNSNSTSKNKNANGTFNFNITNSIWEQTGTLGFYVPTEGMDPTFNLALKDSVLTSTSHLVFSVSKGEIVIDNSNVNNGVYRQLENQSTLTIKNGSVVYATVATSSNAKNPGTTIVDNATYTTTGEFSGSDLGTGTLIVKNGAKFSTGKITKANITINAAGLSAGEVDMIAADLSKFEGTVSVVNNNLEAKIENGNIVLTQALVPPNAVVSKLEPFTLEAGSYMIWPSGTTDVARPLEIVMNFKTNETTEEARPNGFLDWKVDFYLEFEGFENGTITADNCYLAGKYGNIGWVVIPTDGLVLEEGISYPVVAKYDPNITYKQICDEVKDFTAAIHVDQAILDANPNFKVKLSLKMTNPDDANDTLVIGEPAVYTAEDLKNETVVAAIGEKKYSTLQEALADAKDGDTITLLENIELTETVTIPAGKTITLDLAGKTITYNSTIQGEAMITNRGTLTINDTVGSGVINYNYTGAADSTYGKGNYTISNAGNLTVNGGKITIANLKAHAKYPIDNNSTTGDAILVINGGHLYNYNTSAIRQFCNSTTYKNSVTINGGVIEGYCAIWVQNPGSNTVNGSLSITGGEIKSTASAYVNGTSALKDVASHIYCTIAGEGGAWDEASAISITGGTINENVDLAENAPEKITVNKETATFNGRVELPEVEVETEYFNSGVYVLRTFTPMEIPEAEKELIEAFGTNKAYRVRVYAAVEDETKYKELGFMYKLKDADDKNAQSSKVKKLYEEVTITTKNDGVKPYVPTDFRADGKYIFALNIWMHPDFTPDTVIEVKPYGTKKDGTTIYGSKWIPTGAIGGTDVAKTTAE